MIDPSSYKIAYLCDELRALFACNELAIAQIWTPTSLPWTGVRDCKLDTQVMQTSQHPTLLGDPAFHEFRAKSCKQGITGQALGMLGKVWTSGVLQVVQDVSIVPHSVHPRSKLEHLKAPCGTGLMELVAEIVYIPIYDETDPDSGVIAVLEVLISAAVRESPLANLITAVGNVLAELQLSLSKPDPDAEVPAPGSIPLILIPSEPMDMARPETPKGALAGPLASPFADAPSSTPAGSWHPPGGLHVGSYGGHTPMGSWHPPQGMSLPSGGRSPTVISPRQSQLRSYGSTANPLQYGSPPTAPIRYGFLDQRVLVPRPGSPLPCASSDVNALMGDFTALGFPLYTAQSDGPALGGSDWAAVAAKEATSTPESPEGSGKAGAPSGALSTSLRVAPKAAWGAGSKAPQSPKAGTLTRTLSRTSTSHFLEALERDTLPLPCPCTKPCVKGFSTHRQGLAAGH